MNSKLPLSESMRPTNLNMMVGQQHILGVNCVLYNMIHNKNLLSIIFWGPPGVGKTTIARLLAQEFSADFIQISAVFSGIKDIKEAVEQAKQNIFLQKQTILFVDEIHRFNKAQQDSLLPYTENGLIVLFGATTENPSFEINSALLSRVQVITLKPLADTELNQIIDRALNNYAKNVTIEQGARDILIHNASGDARKLLVFLDNLPKNNYNISADFVAHALEAQPVRFNKLEDSFYEYISALHKSIRGSNPDAALYWLTCMLEAGVDPSYLSRRIVRMAWEDIGLSDPRAIELALNAVQTYNMLGSPEGELALAQTVIYLATTSKSNAGYNAFNQASAFVKTDKHREVPMHLRNVPTKLMKKLGYGRKYRYAHDEPHAYAAAEQYFPDNMQPLQLYQPTDRGLEKKITEKLQFLKQLDAEYIQKNKNK